jgi:hypothetical protein
MNDAKIIVELVEALTPFAMAADDIDDNACSGNIWEIVLL